MQTAEEIDQLADDLTRQVLLIIDQKAALEKKLERVSEVVKPQWRTIPVSRIPDATDEAYRMGRNDIIDQIRIALEE